MLSMYRKLVYLPKKGRIIIEKAREERRVIYTRDADFLRIHQEGYAHCGIIYLHTLFYYIGEAIRKVTLVCKLLSHREINGSVKFL